MVSVQAEGCAPIVKAYLDGSDHAEEWDNPETVAAGLRVPKAVGGFLMLDIIRKSGGIAVTVTDEELLNGTWTIGTLTGIFSAPEGGAAFAAAQKLTASGYLKHSDTVVLFLTGSGLNIPIQSENLCIIEYIRVVWYCQVKEDLSVSW